MMLKKTLLMLMLLGMVAILPVGQGEDRIGNLSNNIDHSPIAVAVSPDGKHAISANHTSGSVSLVDLKTNKVITEFRCGHGPADLVWIDNANILVSLLHDDAVALLRLEKDRLTTMATISVGDEPRGISLSNNRAFVALTGIDQVAVIDLARHKVIKRIPVGGQPRTVIVAPNNEWLVTLCNVPGEVFVHDATTYEKISRRTVFDYGFNLGIPVILPDSSFCIFPSPINRTFPFSPDNIEKGWAIDNRLTKLPLPGGKYWEQKQMNLDVRGDAAGDPYAAALDRDANWLVVTCSGSHELMIFPQKEISWPTADPGDFIPDRLRYDKHLFRRVELGGRPMGVKFIDGKTVVVANYLLNSLQVVDVERAKLVCTISLGGSEKPSLARQGEAIFFDADRSLAGWFSCHTCHTDGHTAGQTFDTINDGNFDTYKLIPSLRGVTRTTPWTWHGWQTSLPAAMRKSLHHTLATEMDVTDDDIHVMIAYLATLEHPDNPNRSSDGKLSSAAKRGSILFKTKAACVDCHSGDHFTANATFKVGLESARYYYPEFNPPTLRGLHARRRFLHDGRADSLQEVLMRHHRPEKLTGKKLTDTELNDLIEYLNSL